MVATERRSTTTDDGRRLSFVEVGDPRGVAVLHHHGGLLSAGEAVPLSDLAERLGVRLVAVDRPGVAGSTPVAGRATIDAADDARAVLDHLGIDEVRVTGWSMGGQYALGTCRGLSGRVLAAAVVAGCLPLDDPVTLAELNAMDQRFTAMALEHRRTLEQVGRVWGGLARFAPGVWARVATSGGTDADVAVVRELDRTLAAAARDMGTQPEGIVEEYLAWARPWGFDLEEVATPVDVWHGTQDHLVPPAWAERMVAALPDARLHLEDGAGHFLLLEKAEQILTTLIEREPAVRA